MWVHGRAMHGWCACAGAARTPAEAAPLSSPHASPSCLVRVRVRGRDRVGRHLHACSVARREHARDMRRMQARATLTGHAPGRGAIAPDSSRASLRPSSSALGPGFRVYAAVSSAILRRRSSSRRTTSLTTTLQAGGEHLRNVRTVLAASESAVLTPQTSSLERLGGRVVSA